MAKFYNPNSCVCLILCHSKWFLCTMHSARAHLDERGTASPRCIAGQGHREEQAGTHHGRSPFFFWPETEAGKDIPAPRANWLFFIGGSEGGGKFGTFFLVDGINISGHMVLKGGLRKVKFTPRCLLYQNHCSCWGSMRTFQWWIQDGEVPFCLIHSSSPVHSRNWSSQHSNR